MDKNLPLVEALRKKAREIGFDVCRITDAHLPSQVGERLEQAVQWEFHGDMSWLAETLDRRKSPERMWSEASSAIVLGINYGPDVDPLETLKQRSNATISVYAQHRDYHDVIKGKLKILAGWFGSRAEADVKVFVDTAPLMEKPLAAKAGLGWQGKHTNLVSREFGSWLFLGVILTSAKLVADEREIDHCGSCRACLDVCPTDAFPAPYQLDARRCISYLTIEHDGPIPTELREKMGNRIYGCDDCLAVCPWNKFASVTRELKLAARDDLKNPDLHTLVTLDDKSFRQMFSGSPIKRIKRGRFVRNVLIAIGNSEDKTLIDKVIERLNDEDPQVRSAAVWAYYRLEEQAAFHDMKQRMLLDEMDEQVRSEWNTGA